MNNTEFNITHLFSNDSAFSAFDCSNNKATLGDDAGRLTWAASVETAQEITLLDTEEKREEFRDFVQSSGGWTRDEINAWNETELNALLLQWIAGDVREAFNDADVSEWDWAEYQKDSEAGRIAGRLFKTDDNQIFFSIAQ